MREQTNNENQTENTHPENTKIDGNAAVNQAAEAWKDAASRNILPCFRGLVDGCVAINLAVLRLGVFRVILIIRLFAHAAPA